MSEAVESIDDIDRFAEEVFHSGDPVIVDFWADWCAPCRAFAPTFAAIAEAHPSIRFVKVNTEHNRDIAQAVGIRSLPTIGIFWKGQLQDVLIGAQTPAAFTRRVQKFEDKVAGKGLLARLFKR